MPKTTKRQALSWSRSSSEGDADDDDAVAIALLRQHGGEPTLAQPPSRRQRFYGKRRPAAAAAKSQRPTRTAPPLKQDQPKTKTGNATTNDDQGSDDNNYAAAKKRHATTKPRARTTNVSRPCMSYQQTNDQRHSLNKISPPPPPSSSKKRKRTTATTFRPRRPPIRVNLKPDRAATTTSGMPKGWLTKSQLIDVARRHSGMAIQYRVMYHSSNKQIKDHNSFATKGRHKTMIRYKDLVVQSRFACATGSFGGSTYSFMRWKLPGTLMHTREGAKHVSIYADTRPRLFLSQPQQQQQQQLSRSAETQHPIIVLCSELKDGHRRMAVRFLCNAEPGMTPQEYYSKQTSSKSQEPEGHNNDSVDDRNKENKPSRPVSQECDDEQEDNAIADAGYEGESEPSPAKRTTTVEGDRERRRDVVSMSSSKTRPFLRDANSIMHPKSGSKRVRDKDGSGEEGELTNKRAKNKDYGSVRRNRHRTDVTFHVASDERNAPSSSPPQFLALIEGIAGLSSGTKHRPDHVAEDYIRDIFMNGRVEKIPSRGRMVELPGEAKPGMWIGTLVDTSNRIIGSGLKGMMRDKLGNLKDVRIQLRHESVMETMSGPLKLSRRSSDFLSPLSDSSPVLERIRGGGVITSKRGVSELDTGTISLIDPSHGRRHDLVSQGIVSKTSTLDHHGPFVGSISIAAFDGFTSSTDARLFSTDKSMSLLGSCRKGMIATEAEGLKSTSTLENILPIPAPSSSTDDVNVGVSFICKFALEESYKLLVAHDDEGRVVALDVVFHTVLTENRSSLTSTSSASQSEPIGLTEGMLHLHSEGMNVAVTEKELEASSECIEEGNSAIIVDDDDDDDARQLCDSPLAPERVDATSVKKDVAQGRVASVITVAPNSRASKSAPRTKPSHSSAPKSILKKNVPREVTPAPTANSTKTRIDWSSSDDSWDDRDEPFTKRHAFITPHRGRKTMARDKDDSVVPQVGKAVDQNRGRGSLKKSVEWSSSDESSVLLPLITPTPKTDTCQARKKANGFLAKLEKVADPEVGSVLAAEPGAMCQNVVTYNSSIDDDVVFEDARNVDVDGLSLPLTRCTDGGSDCAVFAADGSTTEADGLQVSSSLPRWPSIHDVFFGGLYDESERVECSLEETKDLVFESMESMPVRPFLSILHQFLFGPDDDGLESLSSQISTSSKQRRFTRCTLMPFPWILFFAFLLWHALVVPKDEGIARTVRRPPGALQPSFTMTLRSSDLNSVPLMDPSISHRSWSESLVGLKYW